METIKLDLIPGKKMPSLHASQYDDGREHGIDLFENGIAYKLDGTETLTINERKVDNNICSMDIENTFVGSSHIEFASFLQMCACAGSNFCELRISKGDVDLGTLNFILEVEPDPTAGGIESESEIRNLKTQVEAITEEVIGDNYYTKTQTDDAIATAIEDKADTTYVDTELANKMDKSNPTGTGSFSLNRKADTIIGQRSFAEGNNNEASGDNSHAECRFTTASGSNSHSEGNGTTASGDNSHAECRFTTASGSNSHSEGNGTTASGENSHAEGQNATASGIRSHAEGHNTTASGSNSHSEGLYTIASHKSQHVFGEYNIPDDSTALPTGRGNYTEIVGNGTSVNNRSNARTLDWSGNETLAGDLTFNGNKSLTSEISRLDNRITGLPEAMVFKGTLGVGGTIETLPTASASNEGWMFKCITAGTYAGLTLKVGDTVTCFNPPNTSTYYWDKTGSQDTDTDTWRNIKVNGVEKLGNGISSGAVDFEDTANVKFEFDANGNKIKAKLDGIYTDSEVDDLLDDKANSDDVYGKADIDTALSGKANVGTSYTKSEEDALLANKADKSDTYTKAQVDDIVYNILPDDTASGSVANFTTSLELPIKSLEIDVNAVQSAGTPTPATPLPISGWSEISLVHCGANLFDGHLINGVIDNSTGEVTPNNNNFASENFISVKENTNIVFVCSAKSSGDRFGRAFYDKNQNYISGSYVVDYQTSITVSSGAYYMKFFVPKSWYGSTVSNNISINYPSTDTEYHAYNGTTEVINLGGTYYGAELMIDKYGHRQLKVTHNFALLNNENVWQTTTGTVNLFYNYPFTDRKTFASSTEGVICSAYPIGTSNGFARWQSSTGYLFGINDNNITLEQVKELARNNQIAICYELATPIIIDLPDGEPIITLNGTNNIYADTGDSTVVFKCSVNDYINAHQGSGAKSLGGVFLGGSNSGSEEEPTEESEETEKTKEIDDPKEEIKTIGDDANIKKIGGE